ncbi:RagB/SusD family nutrient uptake outer membrane protein [Aliifodinibius sp. S!AR15-10]|uniref:RagB/SusD family nutrient uptake outer membrane protein n=1 Tax=Aliifodinibius sp. S!AR15-10 TaxID=2950437 RepID=UPI002854A71A|nr:RagB/SusD family nutrient uptake outer membrane protein [Aliifodinibius sp. S!AR15-10]MDR8394083.1 RagB/SusD family nutrient uptake outer membrane protein [Aliifodinibius sp. S!AR15-10]
MKKLTFIALALLLTGLGGCDDLLDQEPQAQIATSNAYTTPDDASRAVTAAYHPLRAVNWCCQGAGNANGGGYNYWIHGNVATDDAIKGGESGSDQVYAQEIAYYTVSPGNLAVNDAWDILYIGVRNANLVLDRVPDIEMDGGLKDRYLAEAKFLRAYYYFLLVQTFGDVPLILTTDVEAYELERSPRSEVLNQVITDLQEAASVLPAKSEYSSEDTGRATSGAAQAYLGKVYMFMNDFTNAETAFNEVITSQEYSLDPDYSNIFTKAGENGPGTIFSIQYNYDPPNTNNNPMGVVQGSRAMYGWGFNAPTQDFVDEFESGDPRLDHTVYENGEVMRDGKTADVGNSPTGYLNQKEYVAEEEAPGGFFNSANDLILMRLGKVLLWYAEAANENDNRQAARDALNDVRERAREGDPDPTLLPDVTTNDKEELRQAIWHEQRVEYGQEYDRFFDLVRTGRIGEVMRSYADTYNTPKGANFTDGVHEVMPIPPSEISLSEGLIEQNDGY